MTNYILFEIRMDVTVDDLENVQKTTKKPIEQLDILYDSNEFELQKINRCDYDENTIFIERYDIHGSWYRNFYYTDDNEFYRNDEDEGVNNDGYRENIRWYTSCIIDDGDLCDNDINCIFDDWEYKPTLYMLVLKTIRLPPNHLNGIYGKFYIDEQKLPMKYLKKHKRNLSNDKIS